MDAPATLIEHVADRPAHDRRYALDDDVTRRELGWAPAVALEEGLPRTVRWFQENAAWCRATAGPDLQAFLDANYGDRGGADVRPPPVSKL